MAAHTTTQTNTNMRKKNLLDKIKDQQASAACPIASWRNPAYRLADLAKEFLLENISFGSYGSGKPLFEIDPDSGNLTIYWSRETSWRDLCYPAQQLAKVLHPHGPAPSFDTAIRSLEVKLRYDIPMFFNPDPKNPNSYSDGQPVRSDFIENLVKFARNFEEIDRDVLWKVLTPLSDNLCKGVKK